MELASLLGSSGIGAGPGDIADAEDCGSPDLDESLDNHFKYIQDVSAPQVHSVANRTAAATG
jgi:hypothetical protein